MYNTVDMAQIIYTKCLSLPQLAEVPPEGELRMTHPASLYVPPLLCYCVQLTFAHTLCKHGVIFVLL